jgi:hypothetical protein
MKYSAMDTEPNAPVLILKTAMVISSRLTIDSRGI